MAVIIDIWARTSILLFSFIVVVCAFIVQDARLGDVLVATTHAA
jgi:hypothetical protein